MARVERLDTFGAWLLERLLRAFTAQGGEAKIVGLSDHYRRLLEEVQNSNSKPAPPDPCVGSLTGAFELVGRTMVEVGDAFSTIMRMIGAVAVALRAS